MIYQVLQFTEEKMEARDNQETFPKAHSQKGANWMCIEIHRTVGQGSQPWHCWQLEQRLLCWWVLLGVEGKGRWAVH